ncbi:MAG: bestrophin family ion channel [Flavobacteriales bacterium]|nr:bestrophin family ion channel [Flavobacteriales bacterium]
MIKYNPKSWFGLIFEFHRSDTFRKMFWVLIAFGVYAAGLTYLMLTYQESGGAHSSITVHSLLGFVIGLLLVFRTNTAYDRWWEGRKQWGSLVNTTRHLAIQTRALLKPTDPDSLETNKGSERIAARGVAMNLLIEYPCALAEHLRTAPLADGEAHPPHRPNKMASELLQEAVRWTSIEKWFDPRLYIGMERSIARLTDITGACERIRNTPIPYNYNMFLKKFIFVYVMTMPLGLIGTFGYWSVPISVFALYIFGSLELLAEEIEEPFGHDASDLPLDALCETMERNVRELLE